LVRPEETEHLGVAAGNRRYRFACVRNMPVIGFRAPASRVEQQLR
jgi:hypothetical protein